MADIPDNAPAPRLCVIVKWPDFEGYGFNLHAEKSKPGQYIGKVDLHSPAELAGLLEGDRIIEVNGVNIANENHKQVVQRIKAVTDETRLLVLDPKADKYYKSKNIVVRGTQSNVIVKSSAREHKSTPECAPSVSNGHHDDVDNRSVSSAASSSAASEASTQPQPAAAPTETEKDSASPDAVVEETAEAPSDRSPSPLPEEGDDSSEEGDIKPIEEHVAPPVEDEFFQSDENKPLEEEVKPSVEDTSSQEGDASPSESDIAPGDGIVGEAVEAEVARETAQSSADHESDLEAEYDNVEMVGGKGGSEVEVGATSTSRRSSSASSSAGSQSSRCSDTAHTDPSTQSPMSTSPTPPPSLEPVSAPPTTHQPPVSAPPTTHQPPVSAPPTTHQPPPPVSTNNAYNTGGLNLNMSAAEMRARLARKKKADPRNDSLDLRKKYEIIQNM